MTLFFDCIATPIGDLLLVAEEGALVYADFAENEIRRQRLLSQRYDNVLRCHLPGLYGLGARLERYFAGDLGTLDDIAVSLAGTPFQQRVWLALRAIPIGQTRSYSELAQQLGIPAG